ncbi:hypothetical protein B0H19DRAFT_1077142 [Mycena capillaripes]|nr:hypothetical protein B0H19DRAFT_1077142 [Mycena capillaripes]
MIHQGKTALATVESSTVGSTSTACPALPYRSFIFGRGARDNERHEFARIRAADDVAGGEGGVGHKTCPRRRRCAKVSRNPERVQERSGGGRKKRWGKEVNTDRHSIATSGLYMPGRKFSAAAKKRE